MSLQVKYGKDFLPDKSANIQKKLRCLSWFKLNAAKLELSSGDLWVFVLHSFKHDRPDFVIIPERGPAEAHGRNSRLKGREHPKLHVLDRNKTVLGSENAKA